MTSTPEASTSWREFNRRLESQSKFGIELGLERMRRALAEQGHPQDAAQAALVAGTNGKGGTCVFLAGILQGHGRRVGLYTSPHLIDLTERFRVDGVPLPQGVVEATGNRVLEEYGESVADDAKRLTYFELTTLMATLLFRDAGVDVAVYEVGLGGRLDAVNALEPDVSVITNVDRDHTEYLGETLAEIAGEKCGILRAGVPAVVGHQTHAEALEAIEARLPEQASVSGRDFEWDDESTGELRTALAGPFADPGSVARTRLYNASAALEAARRLLGGEFDRRRALDGLASSRWPGRLDWRDVDGVAVLFDSAHNPGAAEALHAQIREWGSEFVAVVCGGMADKELEEMFARLAGGPSVWGATLQSERSASAERLREAIPEDVLVEVAEVGEALDRALHRGREEGGSVLLYGSSYLVGEAFEHLGLSADSLVTYAVGED